MKFFARAGVVAVHIEDQEFPKRCGHLDDKTLIATEEMVSKIQAAKEVSGDMGVIARTDAISVEGFEAALERSAQYVEAGADSSSLRDQLTSFSERETIIQTDKYLNKGNET